MQTNNSRQTFSQRCISDTLDGLRQGLSRFTGPARTALIFRIEPEGPFSVCDPESLLSGHEVRIGAILDNLQSLERSHRQSQGNVHFGLLTPEPDLQLSGLISYGCRSGSVIRHGIETSSRCQWQPQTSSVFPILPLEKWLA